MTRFILQQVRLNKSGYDANGSYWGVDSKLYWAYRPREIINDENEYQPDDINEYIRARDRAHAKQLILLDHPKATFYR